MSATFVYRAKGFTDDVTQCEICGRPELKGTVRLVIVDPDGNEDGEVYAGVVCAAKHAGRTAASIRSEAKASQDAVRDAHRAWRNAQHEAQMAAGDRALARFGLTRDFRNMQAVHADDIYRAECWAWLLDHPEPERPDGYR